MKTLLALSLALSLALVTCLSAQAADPAPAPAPAQPTDACVALAKSLRANYNSLYDVDTRPLAIDQYKVYRDTIEQIRVSTDDLLKLCQASVISPQAPKNLYETKSVSWTSSPSLASNCSLNSVDFTASNSEFSETSVRECLRDGYDTCTVKEAPRAFDLRTGTQNSNDTWNCSATIDLVLSASK